MSNSSISNILKLKHNDKVIESYPSIYSKILKLSERIEKCNSKILLSDDKTEQLEYRIALKKEINELVMQGLNEELGQMFKVCLNVKPENKLPERINIHAVFKKTIVFDFPVAKEIQEVIFNGRKLNPGNYFCIIWLGDLIGFPDSERFITLYQYNIRSISPLIGEMYVYDSISNGVEVCGVIFNQGEEVLEPLYSTIQVVSKELFKAYRINLTNKEDSSNEKVIEGWEYYDKYGKQVSNYDDN